MASAYSISSLFFLFMVMVPILVSSTQFQVGGELGWAKPPKNNSAFYNDWAGQNRFHVGDTVYFKYNKKKDSVLLVNKEDYTNCIVSNPNSKFSDGKTLFEFEHHGWFYFISGQNDHCELGQKMIVLVMFQSDDEKPKNSPPPKHDDGEKGGNGWDSDDFGPPGFNATTRLSVASCFMTALVAMFIVFYLFM